MAETLVAENLVQILKNLHRSIRTEILNVTGLSPEQLKASERHLRIAQDERLENIDRMADVFYKTSTLLSIGNFDQDQLDEIDSLSRGVNYYLRRRTDWVAGYNA